MCSLTYEGGPIMVSYIKRAIMALLVVIPALASFTATAQDFPTSSVSPTGKPWETMRENGFTGGYAEACSLLGISPEQCITYQEMHASGACDIKSVPNGVVVDAMTYTDTNGEHRADRNVLIALENPETRDTEICDLGDGVVVMRFLGCNNHAIVNNWVPVVESQPAQVASTTPAEIRPTRAVARVERRAVDDAPTIQLVQRTITRGAVIDLSGSVPTTYEPHEYSCQNPQIGIVIYDERALQVPVAVDVEGVLVELPAALFAAKRRNYPGEESLPEDNESPISVLYGATFNAAQHSGVIGLYPEPVYTEVVIIRDGKASQPVYAGWVTGKVVFTAPEGLQPGDIINTRFPGAPDSEAYNKRFDVGVVSPGGSGIRDSDPLTACTRFHSAIGGSYDANWEWMEDVRYVQFGQYADYFEGR